MSVNECELHLAEGEALREALAKQIDYYFSRANLSNDAYLVSQMDAQMFVPCDVQREHMNIRGSVPQRAGLEIRLMLPLCSCNDNHDVRQTVIVIDTDLTCQILSRTREIDRKKPRPGQY